MKTIRKILLRYFGLVKYRHNIGYEIINYLADKTKTVGIDNYDDQEELAEHIEWMIKNQELVYER